MPFLNWIAKELRKIRKKYILNLTPEQEEAIKEFGKKSLSKGIEIGIKLASDSISKSIAELSKEKLDERGV